MKNYFLFVLLFLAFQSFGQGEDEMCKSTMDFHNSRMENDPAYRTHVEKHRALIKEMQSNPSRDPACTNGPIIIPVAFHFDNGIVPAGQEACAIQLAEDHLVAMNNDLTGQNADAGLFTPFETCFGTTVGDACVELCLATVNHPTGYGLIEGEPAVTFGEVNFNNINPGSFAVPKDVNWAGYLNIYIDDLSGGLLGEAAGIPGDFSGEGVVIDECMFGTGMEVPCPGMSSSATCGGNTDEGEVLTHEIGHYLGLYHVWGDGGCGQDDMISDTPAMSNNYSQYTGCTSHTQCSNLPTGCGSEDMYMNFMSYAGNLCMYMFSSEQADVMHATSSAAGFTTSSPPQCDASPIPMFSFSSTNLCQFECIDFTDNTTNNPDTWDWTFTVTSGDIKLDSNTSDLQDPIVCMLFGSTGIVEVTLVVTNIHGSNEYSDNLTINIDNSCAVGCYSFLNVDEENDNFTAYKSPVGGFVTGSNGNNHDSKAEYFDLANQGICYPSTLTNVELNFDPSTATATGTLELAVWDNTGLDGNGNAGAPGNILSTTTINIIDILPEVNAKQPVLVDLSSSPVTITTPFYVGFTNLNTTVTSDFVGLLSNTDTESIPGTAWEEWDNGTWYAIDDPNSWGLEISHYMIIEVLPGAPTPSFTSSSGALCDDGTTYTFTNTTSALCTGGTADYFWTLSDAAGLEINTSTNTDFTASFSTTGMYELELCAGGPSCEYDCTTTTLQVLACGNCPFTNLSHPTLPLTESGVADYESGDWIVSEAVILSGASVDYDAIDYVQLNPGFTVELGGVFTAFIDGCNSGAGGNNFNEAPNTSLNIDTNKKEEAIQENIENDNFGKQQIKTIRSRILNQIEKHLK